MCSCRSSAAAICGAGPCGPTPQALSPLTCSFGSYRPTTVGPNVTSSRIARWS